MARKTDKREAGRADPGALVTAPGELEALAGRIRAAGRFGVDMEFRRERTYLAELELIQVAAPAEIAVVDPLAIGDLGPLLELVVDAETEVVLHAGRQDLEIVYELTGCPAQRVFDTQVAAALVGHGDQAPYDVLVRRVLGRKLPKLHTTSDWSRRPLSPEQLAYAVDDVRYLLELRDTLAARLEEAGRSVWAAEEMAYLEDPGTYQSDPDALCRSVKGHGRLEADQLACLRELASWRDDMARRRNLPRRWVVPDDVLVDVARRKPKRLADIEGLRRLPAKIREREGPAMLERVQHALELPPDEWPAPQAARRDEAGSAAAIDLLEVYLRQRADDTGVAVSYLGSRRELAALVRNVRGDDGLRSKLLDGWRRELVGDDLVEIASGRRALRFDPDAGRVVPSKPDG